MARATALETVGLAPSGNRPLVEAAVEQGAPEVQQAHDFVRQGEGTAQLGTRVQLEAVVTAWQEANMTAEMSAQEPRPKSAKLFYETQRAKLKNRIDKELPDGLEFMWTSDEFWWPAYDEVYMANES